MTRHRSNRAPVERAVTASEISEKFFQRFTAAFEFYFNSPGTQSELEDLQRRAADSKYDVAWSFQCTVWGIIGKLLHGEELRELLGSMDSDDRDRMIPKIWDFAAQVAAPEFGIEPPAMPLAQCKYHGHTLSLGRERCPQCPCEIPVRYDEGWKSLRLSTLFGPALYPTYHGRRPEYCSRACRQRAYRRRKASAVPERT